MNNIKKIKNFITDDNNSKIIINQVSEQIGTFYNYLINYFCEEFKIRIDKEKSFEILEAQNLFIDKKINLYYSSNLKDIEKILNIKDKAIIISDYKVFKKYNKKILTLNGYDYTNDINYFVKEELKINNLDILEFCVSNPHLTFSEISKYLVNKEGYVKDKAISEKNNFILEIRKELFSLKRNNENIKSVYENQKKEVIYKKFNFLTC